MGENGAAEPGSRRPHSINISAILDAIARQFHRVNSRRIYQLALAAMTLSALSFGAPPYPTLGIVFMFLVFDVVHPLAKERSQRSELKRELREERDKIRTYARHAHQKLDANQPELPLELPKTKSDLSRGEIGNDDN